MVRRAVRQRERWRKERPGNKTDAKNSSSLRLIAAFGVLAVAVLAVTVYFLWPAGGGPALAFDKLDVYLGTVARDQEGTQTFLVMNRGKGPLDVGPVDIQVEQGCDAAKAVEKTIEIQSGELGPLPIKLGPHRELGPHRLLVNVPSTDPQHTSTTLSIQFTVAEELEAQGKGPRLKVDKEIIHIGDVPYDWPLYEQFTLRNDGDEPLFLEGAPIVRVEEGC